MMAEDAARSRVHSGALSPGGKIRFTYRAQGAAFLLAPMKQEEMNGSK